LEGGIPLEGDLAAESDHFAATQPGEEDPEPLVRPVPSQVHQAWTKYKYWIGLVVFLAIHALYIWISIRNGNSNPTSNVYISLGVCKDDTAGGQPDIIEIGLGCLKVNQTTG
jgi:hypothetical protein